MAYKGLIHFSIKAPEDCGRYSAFKAMTAEFITRSIRKVMKKVKIKYLFVAYNQGECKCNIQASM